VQFRPFLSFALGALSLSIASAARAEEPALTPDSSSMSTPARPPADELPPPGARTALIASGAATTVISYGLALGASFLWTEDDLRGSKDLRIPLAGPWMALGKTGCPASNTDCNTVPLVLGAIVEVIDGVVQAGGLGIVAEGLFLNTSSAAPARKKAEGPTVHAVPLNFEKGGVGLGVVGTF
jgi:hypothetical protein